MRGIDYFSLPDERDWANIFDRKLIAFQGSRPHRDRDWVTNPVTQAEGQAIYTQVCAENDYEVWRERRNLEQMGERVFWKGIHPLDVNSVKELPFDRPRLQPFKMKYDTLEEIRMRFYKTVILIKGQPFLVGDQRLVDDRFYLLVTDVSGQKNYVAMDDIPDMRPAPACYLKVGDTNGWMRRVPARVNQQGMTNQSIQIRRVGSASDNVAFSNEGLLDGLSSRGSVLVWDKAYRRLIDDRVVSALRLSDKIAVYQKPARKDVIVEYKGRRLGALIDHSVKLFDEDDAVQTWLKADAQRVHLEICT